MDLKKILDDHKKWLNDDEGGIRADLSGADLRSANLSYANLSYANLRGADLDFSCWPLWCGSKDVKVDLKIVYQLLAHVACLECKEKEFEKIKKAIMKYAIKSYRAKELGLCQEEKNENYS